MLSTYLLMFFLTLLMLSLLRHAAPRFGLLDVPSGHRTHENPTPLVGGIAVFTGFFLGILLLDIPLAEFKPLFFGCGLLVIVGVLDDVHELSSASRFAAQIVAALVMVYYGGVSLSAIGDLAGGGPVRLGVFAVPLTVFATVGVINAVNMSDGVDGLAGSLLLVAFVSLAWVAADAGFGEELPILLMVVTGLVCFLLFNVRLGLRPHASVFLGDAGAMFLGYMLTWFLIRYSQPPWNAVDPVTALWVVAVPLIDTVTVMTRRVAQGKSPFLADRTHLHHILIHQGLSANATLLVVVGASAAAAMFGIAAANAGVREPLRFLLFLGLFLAHFAASTYYVRSRKLGSRSSAPTR